MTDRRGDLLIFQVDDSTYGVDAALVRETLWLPALAPAVAAPPGVAGLLNLRGEILPVIDLDSRLGRGPRQPRAGDQIVVLAVAGVAAGLVASRVRDLVAASAGRSLPAPDYGQAQASALVTGTLQLDDDLVHILDAAGLLVLGPGTARPLPLPAGSAAERELLQERARRLRQPAQAEERGRRSLAVVALADQYFGIDLGAVREFCRLPGLRPLPCCPPHVAGVFKLRGRLVTLLEIAAALKLPPAAAPRPKAIIASLGEEPVGVAVDDILDVFNPLERDFEAPPNQLQQPEILAIASFAGRRVTVLDLPALLSLDLWTVNDLI